MEQRTEEIKKLPAQEEIDATPEEIEEGLNLLNTVRLAYDQAEIEFKQAFERRQAIGQQYMDLCDWLWEHTPHGYIFDAKKQKYVLR